MMMLRALAVGTDDSEEYQCFTLGFNEESDGSGPGLLMQRGYSFDEQDVELGMDTYCLVTDTQATTYGGIDTWQLAEGWLKLRLSEKAASDLGIDRDLIIQFAPIHQDIVRAAFARIVATTDSASVEKAKASKGRPAKTKNAKAKTARAKTAKTKNSRR